MAPHARIAVSNTIRTSALDRRTLSAAWNSIRRWRSIPRTMAPALHSRSVRGLVAREDPDDLDGGEIAGAVIGSVIGGIVLSLILGFLYFRYRRWSLSRTQTQDVSDKPAGEGQRRVSFPGPGDGYTPGQTEVTHGNRPPSDKDARSDRAVPLAGDGANLHQSPASMGANEPMNQGSGFYSYNQHPFYTPEFDPAQGTGSYADYQHVAATSGGAASYYDTTIAMDSDPEQGAMAPPTRQMTELYQEQLRQAREMRKERKSSKGSTFSRVLSSFKRKRSTQTSDPTTPASPASVRQPDFPVPSIEGSGGLFEEPQGISDGVDIDRRQAKKTKRGGASQDAFGHTGRIDSLRTELNAEPTPDPQLPSSALGQSPNDVPQASTSHFRRDTRLKSPEIPEPMDIDDQSNVNPEILRTSHSPPTLPETFVDPMAIMAPTNDREKYAFNTKELDRIENSTSPPTIPMDYSSPAPVDETKPYEPSELYEDSEEEDVSSETGTMTAHDQGRMDGPSDSSTPAGLSSTDQSSGRTPDTRITPSPSPMPPIKAESTASSPENMSASPKPILHCAECGRTFDQIHKLNHHKRYHERRHVCMYEGCDKKFGTKTHLDRHINDKHEKKKGFHCPEAGCPYYMGGKVFPRKDNWRRHMQNKHGINPQYDPVAVDEATG